MKKQIFSIFALIAVCLSLCSCSNQTAFSSRKDVTVLQKIRSEFSGGFLRLNENGELNIFDYASMKECILCTDTSCKHGEGCSAYNKILCNFVYNDKVYYFENTMRENNDEVILGTQLCTMDTGGKNHAVVLSIENLQIETSVRSYIIDNMLYFLPYYSPWDKESVTTNQEMFYHLCSIDLNTNAFKDYGIIYKGAPSDTVVATALWDNKIYLQNPEGYIDLSTGEFKSETVHFARAFSSKYYVYETEDSAVIKRVGKDDLSFKITDKDNIGSVIGDRLFIGTENTTGYIDLLTGEKILNDKFYGRWCRIIDEFEDSYIGATVKTDDEGNVVGFDYVKISKSDFE